MESVNANNGYKEIRLMAWMISLILLSLHFYYYCYQAFILWQFHARIADHIVLIASPDRASFITG